MVLKHATLSSQRKGIDFPLLIAVGILMVIGLILVYDASLAHAQKDFGDSFYYTRQQIIWATISIFTAIFFSNFDYHRFRKLALPFLLLSLGLILAVFIPGLGTTAGGAQRWLRLGFVTIQPTEIIKLAGVIYLSSIFEKRTRTLPFLILLISVTMIMAVLQRDLGSAAVFVSTAGIMYFASGAPLFQFLILIPTFIASLSFLILTSEYRRKRILAFLDPFSDTQGFTYHISQVLIALGSGGLFGVGLGQSRQKFDYIPEVTTDSIFAIIGEEFGFIGAFVLILLFAFLITRGLKIVQRSEDSFGKTLALGLTTWLGIQTVINLSSMVALLPLTGVPLPFISYGGSALLVNMAAVGILLNISKQR